MVQSKIKLICIVGPTAVGKSSLAIKLAQKFNAEIISADSQLVYKDLNIGTAKPTLEERKLVKHHLIDVVNPNEQFNLAKFENLAKNAIDEISSKDRNIIVVGGTGLYVKALLYGLDERPKSDEIIRNELKKRLESVGADVLYDELKKIDPVTAGKIHPNNKIRLLRALEVAIISNKKPSDLNIPSEKRFDSIMIGLNCERTNLYHAIESRIDRMFEDGWEKEVFHLVRTYGKNAPAFSALGYKEIIDILDSKIDRVNALNIIKQKSRNYAKRQLTWFRADESINWFDLEDADCESKIEVLIRDYLR